MDINYNSLRELIFSLSFTDNKTYKSNFDSKTTDKRIHAINALLNTESIYLERIRVFLSKTFISLDEDFSKQSSGHLINKDQVASLFRYFPSIYNFHATLHKRLIDEINSKKQIGKILFDFLVQEELLRAYECYVKNIPDYMHIGRVIEKKLCNKTETYKGLEHVIMSPIQRFPQLCLAIKDVCKYTPTDDFDKVNIFKAWSIAKAITSRLDMKGKILEYKDFIKITKTLKELSISFSSTQIISKSYVFHIKISKHSSTKVKRLPSILLICDKDLIILPKELKLDELSKDLIFCYPLNDISLEKFTLRKFYKFLKNSNLLDLSNSKDLFESIQENYSTITSSKMDKEIINEYKKRLYDYHALNKIRTNLRKLNFIYSPLNTVLMDKIIVDLISCLKTYEKQFNEYFTSMISLAYGTRENIKYEKVIVFESMNKSNEWKSNFSRTKVFSFMQKQIDWLYFPTEKKFEEINVNELPLVFKPFPLVQNNITNIDEGTMKYQSVMMVVGSLIYRCLWICGPRSQIVILNFDNKQWSILECFNRCSAEQVVDTCTFIEQDSYNKYIVNSEIWLASGNNIYIYCLIHNKNYLIKEQLKFTSPIKALVTVENYILVALKSSIMIYSKDLNKSWQEKDKISIDNNMLENEEIKKLQYGNKFFYVICEKKIIIYEKNENTFLIKNKLSFSNFISAISISEEGVWISFQNTLGIILYDKVFANKFHSIEFPSKISSFPTIGNISSILSTKKYIWIGTETGCIICVSTINSSYCVSSNVPMYFSSTLATKAITEFIHFDNIHPTVFKKNENIFDVNNFLNENDFLFVQTNETMINGVQGAIDNNKDEIDSLSGKSLEVVHETLKDCNLTLILAIGTSNFYQPIQYEISTSILQRPCDLKDQSTIFTFLD